MGKHINGCVREVLPKEGSGSEKVEELLQMLRRFVK